MFQKHISEIKTWHENRIRKKSKKIHVESSKEHGLFIKVNDILIALDCWIPEAELIFLSHAHMDHVPFISPEILEKIKTNKINVRFICTKITKEIAEIRTNYQFTIPKHAWLMGRDPQLPQSIEYKGVKFTIFDNGHAPGSIGIIIDAEERIVYTGDFITEKRLFLNNIVYTRGFHPIPCDYLIMECTYGDPGISFPSFNELYEFLNKIVQENMEQGKLIIITCTAFGKAQIIHQMLQCSEEIILDRTIAAIVRVLEKNGYNFPNWAPYQQYGKKRLKKERNHVLIVPSHVLNKSPYNELISPNAIIIVPSGRVLFDSYRKQNPADIYLPLSDHADFKGIIHTILESNPKKIYLEHGEIEKISYALQIMNLERLESINFLKTPYWI
ncbi:MAG: hypothetical protein ACTSWY_12720 [Promethearchaeota archaeon]